MINFRLMSFINNNKSHSIIHIMLKKIIIN